MVSLEKWYILTRTQKLTKNGEDWGKLIVAKGFKKLPKVQNIAQSGHTTLAGLTKPLTVKRKFLGKFNTLFLMWTKTESLTPKVFRTLKGFTIPWYLKSMVLIKVLANLHSSLFCNKIVAIFSLQHCILWRHSQG